MRLDKEENKIRVLKKDEVLLETDSKGVHSIHGFIGGTALDDVIEAVEKVLKEKFKLEETDYEIEILEPHIEKIGQYGEWVWDYVVFKLRDIIEFDEEYFIYLDYGKEYISIYYSDYDDDEGWCIEVGRTLTEMFREDSENSTVLLSEEEIQELKLDPDDFEPYFKED